MLIIFHSPLSEFIICKKKAPIFQKGILGRIYSWFHPSLTACAVLKNLNAVNTPRHFLRGLKGGKQQCRIQGFHHTPCSLENG